MSSTSSDRITLTGSHRRELQRLTRAGRTEQRLAVRAKIVLAASIGESNAQISRSLRVCQDTVRKWRHRWCAAPGLAALGRCETVRPSTGVHPRAGRRGQGVGLHPAGRTGCPCRGGRARSWPATPSTTGSARRSRRLRCAGGCPRTRSNPGSTSRGSSSPIPTSPPKPSGCSPSTTEPGRENRWAATLT
jgi:hypothetical protein